MSNTRYYRIHNTMKQRCLNSKVKKYKNYGGRGITVCERWLESFENFWEDMKEGYADHLQIDRIDNDKGYCKENCRWVTSKVNNNNRRDKSTNKYYKGNLTQSIKEHNVHYQTVVSRLRMGWTFKKAISTPPHKRYDPRQIKAREK